MPTIHYLLLNFFKQEIRENKKIKDYSINSSPLHMFIIEIEGKIKNFHTMF